MFVIGAVPSTCFAPPPEVFFETADVQSYYRCMQRIAKLHGPEKVAQIIDVDGVLTSRSLPEKGLPVSPRGHMDLAVRDFCGRASTSARATSKAEDDICSASLLKTETTSGVFTVFSSAWSPFVETIERLEALKIDIHDAVSEPERFIITPDESQCLAKKDSAPGPVEVMRHGRAVSCRNVIAIPESDVDDSLDYIKYEDKHYLPYGVWDGLNHYYRLKHLSLDLAAGAEEQNIEVVVFVDDSKENCKIFRDKMVTTKWYKNVKKVYIFNFSNIHGHLSSADLLDHYQEERPINLDYSSSSSSDGLSDDTVQTIQRKPSIAAVEGKNYGSSAGSDDFPSNDQLTPSLSIEPQVKVKKKPTEILNGSITGLNRSDRYLADIDE
jgi:hypothetical protein